MPRRQEPSKSFKEDCRLLGLQEEDEEDEDEEECGHGGTGDGLEILDRQFRGGFEDSKKRKFNAMSGANSNVGPLKKKKKLNNQAFK